MMGDLHVAHFAGFVLYNLARALKNNVLISFWTRGPEPVYEAEIHKADALIEALGYIRKFHGKFVVIKIGGSVMEEPEALRALLVDIVFMQTVGMRPAVVHGGGKSISAAMERAGSCPDSSPGAAIPMTLRSRSSPESWRKKSTKTSSATSRSSAATPRACTTRRPNASSVPSSR